MLHVTITLVLMLFITFVISFVDAYDEGRCNTVATAVIGLIVGLIYCVLPLLERSTLWLALVFLIVLLGLQIYLLIWYEKHQRRLLSTILTLLAIVVLILVTRRATAVTTALWNSPLWQSVAIIPITFVGSFAAVGVLSLYIFRNRDVR